MQHWRVVVTAEAKQQLEKITDERVQRLIKDALTGLAINPNEQGKPLVGDLAGYRSLRIVGQRYRVLYKAEDQKVTVYVVSVGIRREADKADVYEVAKKLYQAYTERQNQQRPPSER